MRYTILAGFGLPLERVSPSSSIISSFTTRTLSSNAVGGDVAALDICG